MRNVFKIVSSVGSVALLLSGAAMAAPPTFAVWSVNSGGDITGSGCGAGAIIGAGFVQCTQNIGGIDHIVTIIAAIDSTPTGGFTSGGTTSVPVANLAFQSQDIVRIGGGGSGLGSKMSIKDTTTNAGTTFTTGADILTGWATVDPAILANKNKSEITLKLGLNVPSTGNNNLFDSTFDVTAVTDSAGLNKITVLGIGQTVGLEGGALSVDKQRFELRNEAAAPAVTGYTITGGSGVLTAAAGAPLQGIWIGQTLGATTALPNDGDKFSIQRLSNLNGGLTSFSTRTSLTATAPVDWGTGGVFEAQFGAVPTF